MAKGGPREGSSGAAYSNRTDLQGGTQAPKAPSGGEYGDRKRLEGLQQAMPLPNTADKVIAIDRPTQRPDEPVTAGVPAGPGPGVEALGADMVARAQGIDPADLEAMRPWLSYLEFAASQANSTPSTRNFVRRVRAALGPR